MIVPTIGRIVWFTPAKGLDHRVNEFQPLAAIVCYVHNDRLVNLCAFDQNGVPAQQTSVKLLQDDDAAPESGYYAEWMPYQKKPAG